MSTPRLQLGYVKHLISQLIQTLCNEINNESPLSTFENLANSLGVSSDEFKPLLQRIKGQVNHISDIERSDLKAKVYSILKKITKKLEKDFK